MTVAGEAKATVSPDVSHRVDWYDESGKLVAVGENCVYFSGETLYAEAVPTNGAALDYQASGRVQVTGESVTLEMTDLPVRDVSGKVPDVDKRQNFEVDDKDGLSQRVVNRLCLKSKQRSGQTRRL